jgi:nucleoside-diphosphate-sugar epimerase
LTNAKKTAHLKELAGADERLKLFEADLLKAGSFDAALEGCDECHHTASPFFNDGVTDPDAQLIRPAVEGTLNVLTSCKAQGVKTIVVTSSTAAVYGRKGGNPPGHVILESQWADADMASENKYHYVVSKIRAEEAVWKFAKEEYPEARIVAVNPTLVIGPMFQPVMNTSSDAIARVSALAQSATPCLPSWLLLFALRRWPLLQSPWLCLHPVTFPAICLVCCALFSSSLGSSQRSQAAGSPSSMCET